METYIIAETCEVTFFHEVKAKNSKEACRKLRRGLDVERNVEEPIYSDDFYLEVYDKKDFDISSF